MEISFSTRKLAKTCSNEKKGIRVLGPECAQRLRTRLKDLAAVSVLDDMRHLPGRCHELKGDRDGQLTVDLRHPYRLVFIPDYDPRPLKPDGGLDWMQVEAILIIDIEDTHA